VSIALSVGGVSQRLLPSHSNQVQNSDDSNGKLSRIVRPSNRSAFHLVLRSSAHIVSVPATHCIATTGIDLTLTEVDPAVQILMKITRIFWTAAPLLRQRRSH
jgi:hypothetical protein